MHRHCNCSLPALESHPNTFAERQPTPNGSMDHAWNLVKLGNDWYHLDATWDDPTPDRKGRILHTYFNVTDSYIKSSHHFNASYYPTMTATKMNFYVRSKQRFTSWKKYKKAAKKAY